MSQHWKQMMQQKQVPECSKTQITGVNIILSINNWSNIDFQCRLRQHKPNNFGADSIVTPFGDFVAEKFKAGESQVPIFPHTEASFLHTATVCWTAQWCCIYLDGYILRSGCCHYGANLPSCSSHNTISPPRLKRGNNFLIKLGKKRTKGIQNTNNKHFLKACFYL